MPASATAAATLAAAAYSSAVIWLSHSVSS